ncbi:peroxiredoxin [Draconibacterium halophilum]|uniref:thioredoxin-dependent peroxiredoxin n=1 Tax=Draconibacterium halophilum TaxID=2706887 RepID=A0A6C0RB12_9BACT|nr:peroxiredoxin [Draconibacterium halophilum]QIA06361.1 peroxiredoxin [Draconibacterium halophilum]
MRLIIFTALVLSISFSSFSQELNVGDKAPSFSTVADDGSTWNVNDYLGDKFIVVYFYPAAMTGGCTKQACAYRDMKTEIDKANAVVVGISGDNVEGLQLFKKANDLNFPLLSDENGEIAKKFGVPLRDGGKITREIEGQNFELVRGATASRWTFIIDKKGNIVYKNTDVDASKDSAEILDFLKNNA